MWKLGLTLAAGIIASALAMPAQAALVCSSTTNLGNVGGTVLGLFTPGSNICVIAGDKEFGNFSSTGGPGTASTTFTPAGAFGNVTLGFAGAIGSNVTATLDYEVVVVPSAVALGWRIDDITKDFSLNQAVSGVGQVPASATLTGTSLDVPLFTLDNGTTTATLTCTRHDPSAGGDNCPVHGTFGDLTDFRIHQTITTGANTNVTVVTDTISQRQVTTPEPASLALLGVGVLGLGFLRARKRQG
jgi:hypothetical protein